MFAVISQIHTIAPFEFINQNAEKITNKDFEGKIYIADFFFTTCPTICPIVERALINWETMVGTSDIGIGFPEMYLLDEMDNKILRKKSPITYSKNITTPTLSRSRLRAIPYILESNYFQL